MHLCRAPACFISRQREKTIRKILKVGVARVIMFLQIIRHIYERVILVIYEEIPGIAIKISLIPVITVPVAAISKVPNLPQVAAP